MLLLTFCCGSLALAQTDAAFGETDADPIKLFERGQDAHARGKLEEALEFYEEAIKLRPEFPEAEFQRATALQSLERFAEAEKAYRRVIELRPNWALPYHNLGLLLLNRLKREQEAETLLRRALQLDQNNPATLTALATIRLHAGDKKESLELARRATRLKDAAAPAWVLRGMLERDAGDKVSAAASLDHAIEAAPNDPAALAERAELRAEAKDYGRAIEDLKAALRVAPANWQTKLSVRLADFYEQAGRRDEAEKLRETLGLNGADAGTSRNPNGIIGTESELAAANDADPEKARPALEKLLERNPHAALLLARLGQLYRSTDPQKSLEYYRRALELEPRNADYATGYGSALVQSRRFPEAASILQRVVANAPDNYAAHANLATALYEMKRYAEAIPEYQWLIRAQPERAVVYYFIATAHDFLGQYTEALAAYETFLSRADAQQNQLEMEKVRLRLPSLRNQIKRGEGVKKKP
ncbi:MAG TPA: tetratricopeptide repeat protein [Pyrinomonadaceae bacterium]|jgi:tetratricopeptide (TPR) repeat protein